MDFTMMIPALLIFIVLHYVLLSIWNLFDLFITLIGTNKTNRFVREILVIIYGLILATMYTSLMEIIPADWHVQLNNTELHTFINMAYLNPIVFLFLASLIAYLVIRTGVIDSLSPIFKVVCFVTLYIGIGILIMTIIQVSGLVILVGVGVNIIVIYWKTMVSYIHHNHGMKDEPQEYTKIPFINKYLSQANAIPFYAFIGLFPLTAIFLLISILFGQEPTSIIKACTETADWTFSMKTPPENLFVDQHYICSVAAVGHPHIVKPIRIGKRHGNQIIVNRQLCIANAFEQVIEERLPRFHKSIRAFYDRTGYPIAKHIRNQWRADFIYYVMKPLEWTFLLVLYMVDVNPEDRIAVQYPHSPISL